MWSNPQKTVDLVTFTEEILNRKLQFLCNVTYRLRIAEAKKFIDKGNDNVMLWVALLKIP